MADGARQGRRADRRAEPCAPRRSTNCASTHPGHESPALRRRNRGQRRAVGYGGSRRGRRQPGRCRIQGVALRKPGDAHRRAGVGHRAADVDGVHEGGCGQARARQRGADAGDGRALLERQADLQRPLQRHRQRRAEGRVWLQPGGGRPTAYGCGAATRHPVGGSRDAAPAGEGRYAPAQVFWPRRGRHIELTRRHGGGADPDGRRICAPRLVEARR